MIDKIAVIAFNGAEIWKLSEKELVGNPINDLLRNEIDITRMQNRVQRYDVSEYTLHYLIDNDSETTTVAVYSKQLQIFEIENFLKRVSKVVLAEYKEQKRCNSFPRGLVDVTAINLQVTALKEKLRSIQSPLGVYNGCPENHLREDDTSSEEKGREQAKMIESSISALEKLKIAKVNVGPGGRRTKVCQKNAKQGKKQPDPNKKKDKKNRQWGDSVEHIVSHISSPHEESSSTATELIQRDGSGNVAQVKLSNWENFLGEEDEESRMVQSTGKKFLNALKNRFGSRQLTNDDLEQVLPAMREKLLTKNVSVPIVDEIVEVVTASVKGRSIGSFQNLESVIQTSLKSTLNEILSPKRHVSLVNDIMTHLETAKKPFIICFCGVNGVGKSTSLSKIAFFLKQSGLTLLIAACDTFRGGAVEQLEVHSRTIGIPLHKQGYGLDAAKVALNAISRAKKENIDVVLIDTAGRMQGHDTRMTALSKLIYEIKPNMTLFVGEALVGNDGCDQLNKFNEHFLKSAPIGESPRGVDAIFLTKFDTIDDKVGTAISMSYGSRLPIAFVGVGQTYQDLKTLDIEFVTKTLMS